MVDRIALDQLRMEAKGVLARLNCRSSLSLLVGASIRAAQNTFESKCDAIKKIGKLVQERQRRIHPEGIAATGRELTSVNTAAVSYLPNLGRNALARKSSVTKCAMVLPFIFGLVAFWGTTDGLSLEKELFGANSGKIFLFAITVGIITEMFYRFGVETLVSLYRNLPGEHHFTWDRANRLVGRCGNCAVTGLWAAIGLHFIIKTVLFF